MSAKKKGAPKKKAVAKQDPLVSYGNGDDGAVGGWAQDACDDEFILDRGDLLAPALYYAVEIGEHPSGWV